MTLFPGVAGTAAPLAMLVPEAEAGLAATITPASASHDALLNHAYCGHGELVAAFHAEALTPDDAAITAKCLWIFKRVAITRASAETSWMRY